MFRFGWWAVLFLGLGACAGEGSDVGPRLDRIDTNDLRVLVHDDARRPVSGATVRVSGIGPFGVTGRSGRAAILSRPADVRIVTVDGASASATNGDQLACVTVAAELSQGELPQVVYLPDLSSSNGLSLSTGAQGSAVSLDDASTTGAIVGIAAGTTVGFSSSTLQLRTAALQPRHLPGELPGVGRLPGQGGFIGPAGVTFSPGASLSLPNDLGLSPGASVELFRLDPVAGTWSVIGTGVVDAGGGRIEAPAGAVPGGGLYVFALSITALSELRGRVVDFEGNALNGVLVRAAHGNARTATDGRFVLAGIAATDAMGVARTINVDLDGGRDLRPSGSTAVVTLAPGVVDLGDIIVETQFVTTVRSLLVTRGRRDPRQRMRVSGSQGLGVGAAVGDDRAEATFDEIAAGAAIGMLTTRVKNSLRVFRADTRLFVPSGRPYLDLIVFGREEDYVNDRGGNGATNTVVVDSVGTGPVRFAAIVRGSVPREGFVGLTTVQGNLVADYGSGPDGQATATLATGDNGRTVRSAFTMVDLDSARTELPVERVRPQPLGAFDRHGLVSGNMTGSAGAGKVRRLRISPRLGLSEWYDEVFEGRAPFSVTPRKVDPEVTAGTAFVVGVPAGFGSLSVVEGTVSGSVFTAERFGLAPALALASGTTTVRDLALDLPATSAFTIGGALTNLDATIGPTDLQFDLGVRLPSGDVVDVARGIGGNHALSGATATLMLPALTGALSGARHLIAWGGAATVGGATRRQQVFVPMESATAATALMAVPEILQPPAGAIVSAAGFTVQWQVPPDALYVVVNLRAENAIETRDWTAVVPRNVDRFRFRELPDEAFGVLGGGLTWTLTVRAERVALGPLAGVADAYRRIAQNWVGISAAERQVDAFSSMSITVTTP